jgi:hypothetical protein
VPGISWLKWTQKQHGLHWTVSARGRVTAPKKALEIELPPRVEEELHVGGLCG